MRIVHPAPHLDAVAFLLQVGLLEILQVVETGPQLGNERALEHTFLLDFTGAVGGELHDFDPGSAEPALRGIGKEIATLRCEGRRVH